ncbi:MAG: hypothetical protein CL797_02210 [Chromatiales bacterium]|jgi:hypothetical protein|nr:hypothetical protein [Chromatiales bacterium]
MRHEWSELNNQQKGTYGEYLAKMEFTMYGLSVFTAEVDDRGIDFVARNKGGMHFDVQVKTITGKNYTYISESKFHNIDVVCLVVLKEHSEPTIYLLKASDWSKDKSGLLNYKHYPNSKEPEYGINFTKKRVEHIQKYKFDNVISSLKEGEVNGPLGSAG